MNDSAGERLEILGPHTKQLGEISPVQGGLFDWRYTVYRCKKTKLAKPMPKRFAVLLKSESTSPPASIRHKYAANYATA